jgi:hypothetical protein
MRSSLLAAVFAATLAAFGCGSVDGGHADATPSSPDADPSAPDADPTAPDADPTVPDAAPGAPDAPISTLDGGGAGTVCGGFAGLTCDPEYFCDWTPNSCGSADQTGECRLRPDFCPDIFDPVCGCNNMTYSNECDANAAGQDIIHTGMCP